MNEVIEGESKPVAPKRIHHSKQRDRLYSHFVCVGSRGKLLHGLQRAAGLARRGIGQILAHWDLQASAAFHDGEDRGDLRPKRHFSLRSMPQVLLLRDSSRNFHFEPEDEMCGGDIEPMIQAIAREVQVSSVLGVDEHFSQKSSRGVEYLNSFLAATPYVATFVDLNAVWYSWIDLSKDTTVHEFVVVDLIGKNTMCQRWI